MEKAKLFSKKVMVFKQNYDEKGRDIGEEMLFLELGKKLNLVKQKMMGYVFVKNFDIDSISVFRGDSDHKNVFENAMAGNLLFGKTGAIIGGLSASSKSWFCEIIEKDGTQSIYRIKNDLEMKKLRKYIDKRN